MKFTTDRFTLVEYKGRNRPVFTQVARGLTFTVDKSKDAIGVDLSGRTVNQDVYDKYFAPPKPEPEAEPEPEQEEE